VSEVSGAKKSHINDIAVQDKRSFFNLDESQVKGFEDKFEGLELESGHAIRVNQETGGSSSGGGRSKSSGGDRGRSGRSNFGGGSGGGKRPKGAGGGRRSGGSSSSGPRSSGGPRSRRR